MGERIEVIYAQALDSEHTQGKAWYSEALAIAQAVAHGLELPAEHGAGIIAALSPQCSWDENVARALAFADGESVGAFGDALRKAERIRSSHPETVLGGRKVRSFYRNIIGQHAHVTVDRHAVAIVCGRALSDTEIKVLERPGAYVYVAAAYRATARRLGIPASELQAITWLAWRRLKGWGDEDSSTF
jgi:nitrous oxidase accessory protein NosD